MKIFIYNAKGACLLVAAFAAQSGRADLVPTSPPGQGGQIRSIEVQRGEKNLAARIVVNVNGVPFERLVHGELDRQGFATLASSDHAISAEVICLDAPGCSSLIVDVITPTRQGVDTRQFASAELVHPVDHEFTGEFVGSPRKEAVLARARTPSLLSTLPVDRDLALGPWLELKTGGFADGASQGPKDSAGTLESGTPLPLDAPGLHRIVRSPQHGSWGTGFMISLLLNSAQALNALHPEQAIYVGGIAKEAGGFYPPHLSHQNGLDADILFIGTKVYASVLDQGVVSSRFNPDLNWQYWRSLTAQKIMQNGKPVSVVAMILVAPEIKTFLCDWAKKNGHATAPEDIDLLKRLRPTEGHDTHFHTRLQCSPYHPKCVKPWDPGLSSTTGC